MQAYAAHKAYAGRIQQEEIVTLDLKATARELESTRADLAARLDKVARHTGRRDEPLPPDFAEQAQELENEELLFALDENLATELRAVTRALQRIEAGEYSECEHCGEDIGDGRLTALPTTTLCINCASAADSTG